MLPDTAYYFQPLSVGYERLPIAEITQISDSPFLNNISKNRIRPSKG
jgi:hypothetical protein